MRHLLFTSFLTAALIFCPLAEAKADWFYNNNLTFYYGSTYRFEPVYRHAFSVDKWKHMGTCTTSSYSGFGAYGELTSKTNFAAGARIYRSLTNYPGGDSWVCTIGAASGFYSVDGQGGWTVAPELGFHYSTINWFPGMSLNLAYGYDLPILKTGDYDLVRHRITLKIGLNCSI